MPRTSPFDRLRPRAGLKRANYRCALRRAFGKVSASRFHNNLNGRGAGEAETSGCRVMAGLRPRCAVPKSFLMLLLAVFVAAVVFVSRQSRRSQEFGMRSALSNGMERFYDKLHLEKRVAGSELSPEAIRELLVADDGGLKHLPSFLAKSNVFLPKGPVKIGSDDLLLVVRLEGEGHAIDCLRRQRRVSGDVGVKSFLPLAETQQVR